MGMAQPPVVWVRRVQATSPASVIAAEPGRPGRRTASTWRAPGRRAGRARPGEPGCTSIPRALSRPAESGRVRISFSARVEGVDHVGGRLGRSEDAVPLGHVHAVDPGLVQRRNARQQGNALRARRAPEHGTRPLAIHGYAVNRLENISWVRPATTSLSAAEDPPKVTARDVDAGGELEQLGGEVRCGPFAGGGVGVRLRVCPQVRDELVDGPGLHGGSGDEDRRGVPDETDRLEVGDRVVTQVLHRRVHAVGGDVAQQEGVAVRSSPGPRARWRWSRARPPGCRRRRAARAAGRGSGRWHGRWRRWHRPPAVGDDQSERAGERPTLHRAGVHGRYRRSVSGAVEHVVGQVELALQDLSGGADERCALRPRASPSAPCDLDLDLDPALRDAARRPGACPGASPSLAGHGAGQRERGRRRRSRRSPRARRGSGAGVK